ncbi:hypothetical protein [Halomarina pelagica]|uniref:hypothetical protein n=1 Tax=Halomarina pelagica TaxID=2961599 RepID=UPI0020C4BD05|nr:hypothetical protein [Halomarina sp. BND7]
MSTNDHCPRRATRPVPPVSGPHAGYDRYGRLDHYYWRCERCGLEATDPTLERGCPRCEEGPDAR